MPEFLKTPFAHAAADPLQVFIRLLVALLLGWVVAWIYLRTSKDVPSGSFPTTLTLLAVLIAMVTHVIGDNIARAFSLVGALSIVRFRTVVRDTKDTAYVIFAVVVGMAVGAQNLWVAVIGIGVIGFAAFVMSRAGNGPKFSEPLLLHVRVGFGHDLEKTVGATLDAHLKTRELMSVSIAKQGASLAAIYEATLRPGGSVEELVKLLNRVEGVQDVRLHRRGFDRD